MRRMVSQMGMEMDMAQLCLLAGSTPILKALLLGGADPLGSHQEVGGSISRDTMSFSLISGPRKIDDSR